MYHIINEEVGGEAGLTIDEQVEVTAQTNKLYSILFDKNDTKVEGLTHARNVNFFETVVFTALRDYRRAIKVDGGHLSDTFFQKQQLEIARYLHGDKIDEIASDQSQEPNEVEASIVNTLTTLGNWSRHSPGYFERQLIRKNHHRPVKVVPISGFVKVVQQDSTIDGFDQSTHELNKQLADKIEPITNARKSTQTNAQDKDAIGAYLSSIGAESLLTAQEEVELSKTIEVGLVAKHTLDNFKTELRSFEIEELEWLAEQGQNAKQRFINANLRLVVSIAKKYMYYKTPLEDIIQEGNLGLMHAVEKFDYTKGYKFSTYATWWIKQAIARGVSQQDRLVRLPVHVDEQVRQLNSVKRDMTKLGIEPTISDLAHELGITESRVLDLLSWQKDHISLDAPVGDGSGVGRGKTETTLGDLMADTVMPDTQDLVTSTLIKSGLQDYLALLDQRSADILNSRFGLTDGREAKLHEIGARHNLSAERIRQLEREALQKLRRLVPEDEWAV